MKPPPRLSHSRSTLPKKLSRKKITVIKIRPTTNEKLVKLWTYFVPCEISENVSGPTTGKRNILPKVIFNPVRPRTTNEAAVSQCEKRSKALKRRIFF